MNAQVVKMMTQGLVIADEIDKQVVDLGMNLFFFWKVDLRMNLEQWTLPPMERGSQWCSSQIAMRHWRGQKVEAKRQTCMYSVTGCLAICAGTLCALWRCSVLLCALFVWWWCSLRRVMYNCFLLKWQNSAPAIFSGKKMCRCAQSYYNPMNGKQ